MKILIGQFIFVAYGSSKPTIWEKYDNKEFKDTEKGRGGGVHVILMPLDFLKFWIPAHHNLRTVIVVELGYEEKVREDTKSWDISRRTIEDTKS